MKNSKAEKRRSGDEKEHRGEEKRKSEIKERRSCTQYQRIIEPNRILSAQTEANVCACPTVPKTTQGGCLSRSGSL